MNKLAIVFEFFAFLWRRRLWWMVPIFLSVILFGLAVLLMQGDAPHPFIYTLF